MAMKSNVYIVQHSVSHVFLHVFTFLTLVYFNTWLNTYSCNATSL